MIVLDMVVVFLVSSYIFFSSSLLIFLASGADLLTVRDLLGVLGVLHWVLLAVVSAWLHHLVHQALGQLLLGLSEPPVMVQWWWWWYYLTLGLLHCCARLLEVVVAVLHGRPLLHDKWLEEG